MFLGNDPSGNSPAGLYYAHALRDIEKSVLELSFIKLFTLLISAAFCILEGSTSEKY